MFYSEKYKLLFIACPKTGSTSVEKYLSKIDPDGETFSITLNDKKITGKDMRGRGGHAKAWEIKEAIGDDCYNNLRVFGFVRDPYEKLVSSYFFARSGKLKHVFKKNGKVKFDFTRIKTFLSMLMAKLLPFTIWVLLFPMKTNYEYYFDTQGKRIVKYLGRTDHLNEDMVSFLKRFEISADVNVPHVNKSNHKNKEHYFRFFLILKLIAKKYKKDIELYNQVVKEMS